MKIRIRRGVLALAVAAGPVLGLVPASPAVACNGEICDGICDFWNAPPPPKGECPLR